ncbi:hypothetical protein AC529_19040 [Thermobifida cellulosilytica TB100]|uniref:ABC transmembrane type-1 domain-containing protein n=1 Tax=Thermobifida cellulosilytica TB100 TaxID=665004 RepID=A0A147KD34_THECS|nr:hypothetical protein AC529_19040 [Thermobifida cellulosilytica TB100]
MITARLVICAAFLVLWEVASRREWVDPMLFGNPTGVWTAMVEYLPSERSLASLEATGGAVGVSFVIGSVSGTLAGLVLGLSPVVNGVFGPFLAPINSVPRIALAPLFIAWFGLTMTSKVVLAVSIVFFILAENARSAVWSVDADLMTMARVVGLKRAALLWKVVLPSAVPTMFAGLRLTFTYALLGVVASEMVAATGGLGQDIVLYSSSYQINTVFAILVELMVIAVVVNWIFNLVERRLLVWQET